MHFFDYLIWSRVSSSLFLNSRPLKPINNEVVHLLAKTRKQIPKHQDSFILSEWLPIEWSLAGNGQISDCFLFGFSHLYYLSIFDDFLYEELSPFFSFIQNTWIIHCPTQLPCFWDWVALAPFENDQSGPFLWLLLASINLNAGEHLETLLERLHEHLDLWFLLRATKAGVGVVHGVFPLASAMGFFHF